MCEHLARMDSAREPHDVVGPPRGFEIDGKERVAHDLPKDVLLQPEMCIANAIGLLVAIVRRILIRTAEGVGRELGT